MKQKEENLSRGISALSRRNILNLLLKKERTVKEISNSLNMSVSLASRHLKLLYDLGFLKVRKEFPYKFYYLKIKKIKKLLEVYETIVRKQEDYDIGEENLSRAINAYSRRKILKLLANKELTVKEISEKTKISMSLASRHLKLLYDLKFLNVRVKFPNKFYSLKVKSLKDLINIYDEILKEI